MPQLIVPPHPSDTVPQAVAGQVTIGWQQLVLKQTWLPARLLVKHMSLTKPSEKTTLPAPMIVTLTEDKGASCFGDFLLSYRTC